MKKLLLAATLATVLGLMTGCAPQNTVENRPGPTGHVSGFFNGWFHGATAFFGLVGSLFNKQISCYDVHNDGLGYNLGWIIGAGAFCGGTTIVIRRRK